MKKMFGIFSLLACLLLVLGQEALAAEDAALYKRACAGCHGQNGEKSSGGSDPIMGKDIQTMLMGYKDGSYGGKQKVAMQNVVRKLSDDEIKAVSDYTKTLK